MPVAATVATSAMDLSAHAPTPSPTGAATPAERTLVQVSSSAALARRTPVRLGDVATLLTTLRGQYVALSLDELFYEQVLERTKRQQPRIPTSGLLDDGQVDFDQVLTESGHLGPSPVNYVGASEVSVGRFRSRSYITTDAGTCTAGGQSIPSGTQRSASQVIEV